MTTKSMCNCTDDEETLDVFREVKQKNDLCVHCGHYVLYKLERTQTDQEGDDDGDREED